MTKDAWDRAIADLKNMTDAEIFKFAMDSDGVERKAHKFQLDPKAVDKVGKLAAKTKLKVSQIVELLISNCPDNWDRFSVMCAVPSLDRVSYREVEEIVEDYDDIKNEIKRELPESYRPEDIINAAYTVGMQYIDDGKRNKVHSIARQMRGEV